VCGGDRDRHELDSSSAELAGDSCPAVPPVGSKFFQAVRALGEEADGLGVGVVGFEQEPAVAELALDSGSGVLAGHAEFLPAVGAFEQEAAGFDLWCLATW
jgi:hypothetical protein